MDKQRQKGSLRRVPYEGDDHESALFPIRVCSGGDMDEFNAVLYMCGIKKSPLKQILEAENIRVQEKPSLSKC